MGKIFDDVVVEGWPVVLDRKRWEIQDGGLRLNPVDRCRGLRMDRLSRLGFVNRRRRFDEQDGEATDAYVVGVSAGAGPTGCAGDAGALVEASATGSAVAWGRALRRMKLRRVGVPSGAELSDADFGDGRRLLCRLAKTSSISAAVSTGRREVITPCTIDVVQI